MTTDPVASDLGSAPGRDGDRLLRRSLNLDAVASGGLGLLLAAAGSLLDEPLGIPASVLVPVGVFLVAYAAALWFVGSRPRVSRPAVWVVVVGNLLWVAASVVAAIAGWWSPTAVGTAFVLAQAAAVALFAELQFTGLRRAPVEMA
ncbi:MAG TPA: hypothetical protein VFL71_10445 [Actinomycetes bacterium]|jgi:hypothetical protein|nr:hypothetical protein [Actinomycetes bacterium]